MTVTTTAANPLADLVRDAKRDLDTTETDLVRKARQLMEDLQRTIDAIENGQHVNDLGVVQSRGLDIDRLCALRQERVNNVHRLEYVTERMAAE